MLFEIESSVVIPLTTFDTRTIRAKGEFIDKLGVLWDDRHIIYIYIYII